MSRYPRRSLPYARSHLHSVRVAALVAALTVIVSSIAIPAANAASHKYAKAVPTSNGTPRYSGYRASITGGKAVVRTGGGTVTVITYHPAPGYSEVASATTGSPYAATLSHRREKSAHSKCYWMWGSVGGKLDLNCWVYW